MVQQNGGVVLEAVVLKVEDRVDQPAGGFRQWQLVGDGFDGLPQLGIRLTYAIDADRTRRPSGAIRRGRNATARPCGSRDRSTVSGRGCAGDSVSAAAVA
ncbi:hypothetical protein AB0883_20640 [Micromonospora sp. NPDC047812]|uniref:hypothetical protein n=1 Tax=Micromonospora sp. NPDC047812 TaxID=3155742 RepID=UPI003455B79D